MSRAHTQQESATGSGFEKRGGYASPKEPLSSLPKVPAGPAPGAAPRPPARDGQAPAK